MASCPQCGAAVSDGSAFCESCGAAVNAAGSIGSEGQQSGATGATGFGAQAPQTPYGSQGQELPGYQSYGSSSPYGGNQLQGGPNRNPFDWYLEAFRKYATFQGRASRSEYWWFTLFNFVVIVVFDILDHVAKPFVILELIYILAVFIPSIALTCRRLHDVGMSGWLQLISIVPLIGWVVMLIFTVRDSQPMTNQYGPNPKAVY